MINNKRLNDVLVEYKKNFISKQWPDEKFKWEAVKNFQSNWDINSNDFTDMLNRSLDKTYGLLASAKNFPKKMIVEFARMSPEEVRAIFIALFDENDDLCERIDAFKSKSTTLLENYGKGAKQHFQYENAISTYLWLRYPDKYYIFKYGEIKTVAEKLESSYRFKKGTYAENIKNNIKLCDDICFELQKDNELIDLLKSQLTDSCYHDPELRTLTSDICFYISRFYSETVINGSMEWFPADYSPGLTVADWVRLLNDRSVFTPGSLEIMKRLKDYGGQATCSQLTIKYGETKNFYNSGSVALARRVAQNTGCPVMDRNEENSRWWPILYMGRHADVNDEGVYVWKLRDELAAALDQIDLKDVELYVTTAPGEDEKGYWWLNANPKIWRFSEIAVGEAKSYTLYNENGNKRRIYQNFLDAKAGDMVICYESNPVKQIVAIGKITAEQDDVEIFFEKIENLISPIDYSYLKSCPELVKMEFFTNQNGSLFKLTKGEYEFIYDIIREENPVITEQSSTKYDKKSFLRDVYISEQQYESLYLILMNKMNVILQGAPGVGKTFAAKRLAYSIMGEIDDNRIEFVQFHQNYSYEDFVMGYKPAKEGFELKNGVFHRFCQKASNQPEKAFFFIIDEINRGNLSKIFGELLMLIERDYREHRIVLIYNGMPFSVPKNLYIIGMMNTADRSLAMIDYALRRRFSFFDMEPAFVNSEGFKDYQNSLDNETFNTLIDIIIDLNKEIASDRSLGKGFCIGHSYFCGRSSCTHEWLKAVVEYEIIPMLSEYWFDDEIKLQRWENNLRGVFYD